VFFNRSVMFRNRSTRDALLEQHRAINDAVQARDPEAARAAIARHMEFVDVALHEQQKSERNEALARLRLLHEAGR
jgi:GntR family transcriptional repressor for pyruvate dehydrogenase complex